MAATVYEPNVCEPNVKTKDNLFCCFRVLLKEADLSLIFGRRYGLVGRNGIGKTTLIKMLSR